MPHRLLTSDTAEAGGILTVVAAFFTNIYEFVTSENVSNGLEFLMAIGGLAFVVFKVQNMRLQNKKLKNEINNDKNTKTDAEDGE